MNEANYTNDIPEIASIIRAHNEQTGGNATTLADVYEDITAAEAIQNGPTPKPCSDCVHKEICRYMEDLMSVYRLVKTKADKYAFIQDISIICKHHKTGAFSWQPLPKDYIDGNPILPVSPIHTTGTPPTSPGYTTADNIKYTRQDSSSVTLPSMTVQDDQGKSNTITTKVVKKSGVRKMTQSDVNKMNIPKSVPIQAINPADLPPHLRPVVDFTPSDMIPDAPIIEGGMNE